MEAENELPYWLSQRKVSTPTSASLFSCLSLFCFTPTALFAFLTKYPVHVISLVFLASLLRYSHVAGLYFREKTKGGNTYVYAHF